MRKTIVSLIAAVVLLVPSTAFAAHRYSSTTTFDYNGGDSWSGTISSSTATCLNRTVKLVDPNGHVIGITTSDSDGAWAMNTPVTSAGTYTAVVTKKYFKHHRKLCSTAKKTLLVI